MLVLKRYEGERILIGEGPNQITVEFVRHHGQGIRLGITAPPEVRIDREEVRARRERERLERVAEGGAA